RPEMIIELGTGVGISTMYLASGSPETPLHSIERDQDRAAQAAQLICRCSQGPVSIHWGGMEEKLEDILALVPPRFLAFVDGNHRYEPTLDYVRKLLERAGDEALIVMDDIYWSKGMQRAWKEIISWPEVHSSIDLFHMGILLLRKDLSKTEIKIKF
ncbi:MAG: class I SAM-dependent methyltransferase, partial [Bacteroidota bacterium]|nr:class I SAM-dependent methyltransferase [Bacteroidota bacterium]